VSVFLGNGDGTFQPRVTYNVGSYPDALVTGDFNGDGRTDLAVANAGDGTVSVLLGNGNGTFQPQVTSTVGSGPDALVAADFNGDGHTDLAVANYNDNDVSMLLGNGDGTFQPQVTTPVGVGGGDKPAALAAGDFRGDGRTDLAVALEGDNVVWVFLGNGNGTFQSPVTYVVGSNPIGLAAGDFTGDGRTDLAVANTDPAERSPNYVSVLLGNGDGTFQPQVLYPVGLVPDALVTGDFRGNGRIDLATANYASHDVSVLLGNGDGTFQPQVTYATGNALDGIVAGDFRGDRRTDLAVANYGSASVSVLLGNGDGTFQSEVSYPLSYGEANLVMGDFGGDGRTDLAAVNNLSGSVSVFLGNGDGTFQAPVTYALPAGAYAVATGDFRGDGRLDLAVVSYVTSNVVVLLGNGDGSFQTQVTNPVGSGPFGLVAGDFNGDGRTDLASVNSNDNTVSVLLGNGNGTFQAQVNYAVGSGPAAIVVGDFNGDGRTDLATVNSNDDDVSVLLGNGDGTFQAQRTYPADGIFPVALVAGDFNGDGRIDLATADQGGSDHFDVSLLLGNGDGSFQPPVLYPVAPGLFNLTTGDFTGHGRTDLAVTADGEDAVSVLLSNGDGTFQPYTTYAAGAQPFALVADDFNGDGRSDLAVANAESNNVSVLLGNGNGTFQSPVNYLVGGFPLAIAAGDFNGDGRDDLAIANSGDGTVSVLLNNGDGTFQPQVGYRAGSGANWIATGDFNGDGHTDLAVANANDNDVSVLLNNGDGTFAPSSPSVAAPVDRPVVADLTGDGVSDAFVINGAGAILWRRGRPQAPGTFDPPITINPGHPARDIVAVDTNLGPVLAGVDATDNAISLYAWRGGAFDVIGSLPTGSFPAHIVAANLSGGGASDLVVRNASDGTLSVYLNTDNQSGPFTTLPPPFAPPITVPVGPGASDVSLAPDSGDGRTDIVVTYSTTGEVGVVRNLGPGVFAPPVLYPAGSGLYAVSSTSAGGPAALTTLEATAGVAAANLTPGGPADLVAVNPGSNTLGILSGLSAGRFSNPVTLTTASPPIAVLAADLESHDIPDIITLSTRGVTVYRGDGKGGFLADPFTIGAGPEPTGITVADINHDGKPDLLVGNAYGDLLVLLGNGDGTFQPYHSANQDVALAVLPNGSATPDFVFADQGLNQVVVDSSNGQSSVLANQTSGLLAPGAVVLADLNGDGIPDLIVANSGGNNVLVYRGLGNGQFGPELNGSHGFDVGTNPVSITVADLNGRPDLVVVNQGSNDVSILLNEPTADGGFTFVRGPRLQGGDGPTSTAIMNVPGNSYPYLLVSDGGPGQVRILPGVGNGFFIDSGPQVKTFTLPAGSNPVQVMAGGFLANQGAEIATVDRGTSNITVISDFTSVTAAPVFDSFSTGGIDPVQAIAVTLPGQALESLIVANTGDGLFTLLGGAAGLGEEAPPLSDRELPEPTALAAPSLSGNVLSFYAATAGMEAAFTLAFILPGFTPATAPVPGSSSAAAVAPAQLVALTDTSLALVGTLLVTMLGTPPSPTLTVLISSRSRLSRRRSRPWWPSCWPPPWSSTPVRSSRRCGSTAIGGCGKSTNTKV
jgi:hypothetical protein